MKLAPIDPAQLAPTVDGMLDLFDNHGVLVPSNLTGPFETGKSLLRGLQAGQLVVCQVQAEEEEEAAEPEAKPPAAKKKTRRKKAA